MAEQPFDWGDYLGRSFRNLGRSIPIVEAFVPSEEELGLNRPRRRTPEEQTAVDYGTSILNRGPGYYDQFAKDLYGQRAGDINQQAAALSSESARRFSRAGLGGSGFSAQAQGQVGLNQQRALTSADIAARQYAGQAQARDVGMANMLTSPTIGRDDLFRQLALQQEQEQRDRGYQLGGDILALAMGLPPIPSPNAPIAGGNDWTDWWARRFNGGSPGQVADNFLYGPGQVIY